MLTTGRINWLGLQFGQQVAAMADPLYEVMVTAAWLNLYRNHRALTIGIVDRVNQEHGNGALRLASASPFTLLPSRTWHQRTDPVRREHDKVGRVAVRVGGWRPRRQVSQLVDLRNGHDVRCDD